MNRTYNCGILGLGSCLPEKVITNSDLEKMVDTSDEWITKRTGISERRILDEDIPTHKLGVEAAKKALADAGLKAEDLDLIIVTTETPDYLSPSMSCLIQSEIGATKAAAFDLNAACSGFIYGMSVANQFIKSGFYKYVLIIGCEGLSKVTDWKDRNTCVLFGDGAGAVLFGPVEEDYGIITTYTGAAGELGKNITIPCCFIGPQDIEVRTGENKRTLWMDGGEVFKFAVKIMEHAAKKVLEDSGLTMDDIKMIVPHQANIRILEGAAKRLNIPNDKVFSNLYKYGNISSASIPVGLDEAYREKIFSKGDSIILVGFGGGLTWGSAIIKWNK
ncbi:beta-ketoacyl-ACP synthase III [Acetivibrio mesophilus]|uniref:Beta-ketoacyl-[acyl-carrier-protein] synthase III n=1 Tax=Acetivibrio mesophilus TaxID=2487273 RepID=A0A4Q0I685_9FIRM|nr:beta-ketoacyl-ACP synthase III [Acetivibrio mesophilus]ODM25214.1 3-oxoacyl-ACP synthase [Clostridium sp. Bc-iso-3]RXE59768.1 ketoacyl-ACP synthase III [Acetivibrio mesophilus]HHV29310.1 ketoacyl-ACP synthase III [Clostridium sp.]